MHQCTTCSFVAKNKAGLSAHVRSHGGMSEESAAPSPMPEVPAAQFNPSTDCPHCSLLPAGSVNITSMFIVVVFCLTAVMFVALYKLNEKDAQIRALRAEVSTYETAQAN